MWLRWDSHSGVCLLVYAPGSLSTQNHQCWMGFSPAYVCSANVLCARRTAFTFFILFFTDGFVKYARFLNSFRTPDRSYFFLNRFSARSIGSFSDTIIPTKLSPPQVLFLISCIQTQFTVCFTMARTRGFQEAVALQAFRTKQLLRVLPVTFVLWK